MEIQAMKKDCDSAGFVESSINQPWEGYKERRPRREKGRATKRSTARTISPDGNLSGIRSELQKKKG